MRGEAGFLTPPAPVCLTQTHTHTSPTLWDLKPPLQSHLPSVVLGWTLGPFVPGGEGAGGSRPGPRLAAPFVCWLYASVRCCAAPVFRYLEASYLLLCLYVWMCVWASLHGSNGKESTCNAGDLGSVPGSGRSSGGRHGNLLQDACLENPHGQREESGRRQSMVSQRVGHD